MTKEEARSSVMGAISMALKDPILQQGFEIICKNLVELEKQIEKMKNCANCGQLVAKDGGYKGFLHTYRTFCCKDCYKAYKEKHKG